MKLNETLGATTGDTAQGAGGRSGRVVVVGSANLDILVQVPALPTPGETVIGDSIRRLPGGKGANQAVAAARAGATVAFVSAVGVDEGGRLTLDSLASEGIDSSGVRELPDVPTGSAIVLVAHDGENEIAIVQGANAELTATDVERAMSTLRLDAGDVVLVSFEITDEAVTAAAASARRAGAYFIVNPAPARPLNETILGAHPLLLPNTTEAQAISGLVGEAGARRLATSSGAPVIVTLGGDGVLLVDGEQVEHLPAMPTTVVDTTGAGDTFAGILSARIASGDALEAAISWAAAGAAISVSTAGAREGSPTLAQIEGRRAELGLTPTGG